MRENVLIIINHLLSSTWLFVVFGIVYMIVLEKKCVLDFPKKKKIQLLAPLFKRASYLIGGLLLIFLSFAIVNYILGALVPETMGAIDYGQATDFWSTLKYQTQYTGLFAVIGVLIAGISLVLSAGGKWLVTLAKLFLTLTVLYIFFSVLIAYS